MTQVYISGLAAHEGDEGDKGDKEDGRDQKTQVKHSCAGQIQIAHTHHIIVTFITSLFVDRTWEGGDMGGW